MNLTKSDLYKDIIERFNSKRLPYAIIKNYESFPSVVNDLIENRKNK